MSKFFKALEQAERERALGEVARRQEADPTNVAPPAPAACREDVPSAQRPLGAEPGSLGPIGYPPITKEFHAERKSVGGRRGVLPEGVEEHLVSLLAPSSFDAEPYRELRHLVEQLHKTADLSIIGVSSSVGGDGKTTTAINLAGALAQAPDARVLLVDADLRHSSIVDYLGLEDFDGYGLENAILKPNRALEDVVQRCGAYNFSVLAARRQSAPYELLRSPRLGELLAEARRRYEYVVLDTPPLVQFPDCRVMAKWVDGFVVVVKAHKTPRKLVEEALNALDPAKVVGLVFNGGDRPLFERYYVYRHSRESEGAGQQDNGVKQAGGSLWGGFGRVSRSQWSKG